MQAILQRPRTRAKSTKPVTFAYYPSMPGIGSVEISRGDKSETYDVKETHVDAEYGEGRGFRLRKQSTGNGIHCFAAYDSDFSTCDCEDWTYAPDEQRPYLCKHLTALHSIIRTGEIDREDAELPTGDDCLVCDGRKVVADAESVIPTALPCPNCVEVPEPVGTILCPVCQSVASLVPLTGERVTHAVKCPTCEGRQTACIFCYLPLGAADADRYAHAECSRREIADLRSEGGAK